ncbi:MAG: hypothetical protein ACKPKO_20760, partial [Candidatus Fonsibacter sp.]
MPEALDQLNTGVVPIKIFEVIGYLPGRESGTRDDPTRPLRKRINALKIAVHTDKISSLTLHLNEATQQNVFAACTLAMQQLNTISVAAFQHYEWVKRALERELQNTGVTQRWQETDSGFGWWLIENLELNFLVLATSDLKWYAAGTWDDPPDGPNSRLAFPVDRAQKWMVDLMSTRSNIPLADLIWEAYAYKNRIPAEARRDWNLLDGFTIY